MLVGHLGVSRSSRSSLELDCLHKRQCNFSDVILANISSVGFFTLLSSQHTKIPNSGPQGPFTQGAISQALKAGLTLSQAGLNLAVVLLAPPQGLGAQADAATPHRLFSRMFCFPFSEGPPIWLVFS